MLVHKKSSTSQICASNSNWDVLFKVHYEFDTEQKCSIVQGIYARDMQCDQIILVFLLPVFRERGSVPASHTDVLAPVLLGRLIHTLREPLWI